MTGETNKIEKLKSSIQKEVLERGQNSALSKNGCKDDSPISWQNGPGWNDWPKEPNSQAMKRVKDK